ncbi:MAG: dolichol-phosphate mannosyltransferase [Candidatus Roseilinea sp.]|nr:MAG: dolichol-phosphate mannosyltransferase [Candidatus Roseilinea sp.]
MSRQFAVAPPPNFVIFIVLPAYNEAEALPRLLARIAAVSDAHFGGGLRVILANDGSTDGTPGLARAAADTHRLHLDILTHKVNRGLGEAIKTGLKGALERSTSDDDVIITMDSDDTHLPGLIPRMVMMIEEGNDLVIASRYQHGSRMLGIPRYRQLLSTGLSWLFRIVYPIPGARDYSCGYRAYRAGALRAALNRFGDSLFVERGFACMVDILIKMHLAGATVNEVPMILRYDRKPGATKMPVKKTIVQTFRLLARRRFGVMD